MRNWRAIVLSSDLMWIYDRSEEREHVVIGLDSVFAELLINFCLVDNELAI